VLFTRSEYYLKYRPVGTLQTFEGILAQALKAQWQEPIPTQNTEHDFPTFDFLTFDFAIPSHNLKGI